MKVNEIEELLVRYYDGETNEAEEKELKEFFAQADVPAHLLAEKRLFMQLASSTYSGWAALPPVCSSCSR